jgi:hypothetical protein
MILHKNLKISDVTTVNILSLDEAAKNQRVMIASTKYHTRHITSKMTENMFKLLVLHYSTTTLMTRSTI